jgi:hypothetical protein
LFALLRVLNARNLLLAALGCGALYFVALHPWTGSIGGIVFLLLGWALPTAFVVLLALGLAFLLPVGIFLRLVVALVLSFLLGVNTALPDLPGLFRYQPDVSMQVLAKVPLAENPNDAIRIKRRPWPPLFTHPLEPQLRIGSDEGCMCMYFKERAIYSDALQSTMLRVGGTRGKVGNFVRATFPAQEQNDVHLDAMFWHDGNELRAMIEVVDHGKPIARFAHRRIPRTAIAERKGVGREKLAENFWENAAHLFMRDNAWSDLIGQLAPSYYPERQIEEFLREVGAG